jgi:hypothetical protein
LLKFKESEDFNRRHTLSISRIKSEFDAEIGQKGIFFIDLSVDVHVYMMTHAIPNTLRITVPAMVMLTVNKGVLVVNGFVFTYPLTTMRTVNILDVFFFHGLLCNNFFIVAPI